MKFQSSLFANILTSTTIRSVLHNVLSLAVISVATLAHPSHIKAAYPVPVPPDSTAPPYHPFDTLASDLVHFFTDAKQLFARPAHFSTQQWYLTGGVAAGTGLLMSVDESLRREMLGMQGRDGDKVAEIGNSFGEHLPGIVITGSLYTVGFAFNCPKIRVMGRHVGQSLMYSALVTTILKSVIGRHRPFLNDGAFAFEGPVQFDDPFLSHPSGHTTVTFAIASSLAADIDNPYATVGLYSLASLTAVSRMYSDRHWSSDVFLAAAIATAIGYGTANLDKGSSQDDAVDGSSFFILPSTTGVTVGYRW